MILFFSRALQKLWSTRLVCYLFQTKLPITVSSPRGLFILTSRQVDVAQPRQISTVTLPRRELDNVDIIEWTSQHVYETHSQILLNIKPLCTLINVNCCISTIIWYNLDFFSLNCSLGCHEKKCLFTQSVGLLQTNIFFITA